MKILIAVDGSSGGFEAVRQAGQLLDLERRDEVALYYSPPQIKFGADLEAGVIEKARSSLASVVFEEARALLPEGLRAAVTTIIGTQPPKLGIVHAAEACGAAMIAVGARGLGPIKRLLLGSVSTSVMQTAHVPVLVARPRLGNLAAAPLKVLIACKSANSDRAILDFVGQLHWLEDTQGVTVSVVLSMFAGHVPDWLKDRARGPEVEAMAKAWTAEHEAEVADKLRELETFNSSLPAPLRTTRPVVMEGHAAEQLLAVAASREINLIVIGAHDHSAMERWLVGSTTSTVVNHAPCSVLVIRAGGGKMG